MQYALVHAAKALATAADYDIVHSHNGPPSEIGMSLSHLTPTPMLTTLHCQLTEDSRYIWSNYAGWYNVISHQQAAVLPALPHARYAGVVHNSIDVESFPFQAEKEDYLLFMGRISPEKAPDLAVEAARRLGMKLVIAAKMAMPWEKQYYKEVLEPLLDDETARYIGEVDAAQKRELYATARCLLVPLAWEEPFGLVMIEAMACGTPVVAFHRGAAPELIEHGVNGFLVDDVDGMVEAVRRIGSIDPKNCRRLVEERFSSKALAVRYLEVYEKILAGEPAGSPPAPSPWLPRPAIVMPETSGRPVS
jgi:glycosyltransferase involved in cell wall biosynthesis